MFQLGDINSSKNWYKNTNFRKGGSINDKCKSIPYLLEPYSLYTNRCYCSVDIINIDNKVMKKSHSRNSHNKNIILENLKSNKSKGKKMKKFKRKKIGNSQILSLFWGGNYQLKRSVHGKNLLFILIEGLKPVFPVTFKRSQLSEKRGSRERSNRRSKQKRNKWKSSPYKSKLTSKIQKLKNFMSETPNNLKKSLHNRKSNMRMSEYSNFINGHKKRKVNCKFIPNTLFSLYIKICSHIRLKLEI